ncbi:MAG: carotenoid biosynthesis protein [Ekhidna sp.]|nr:carotenoid biosynthesis protein [Ekhidna sp.]
MDKKINLAIGLVWLFHVSGIIGIFLGFQEWFLPKTQLNLLVCFILLILVGNLLAAKKAFYAYIFFIIGMFMEWLGVHYGWPFGNYEYGGNLGAKLDGVPYMIGINWCMLTLITGSLAEKVTSHKIYRPLLGASLMVGLDFLIEPSVHILDFWYWSGGTIPVNNYIGWFVIAFALHYIYQRTIDTMNFKFSLHLYLAQVFFFISFYVYTNL